MMGGVIWFVFIWLLAFIAGVINAWNRKVFIALTLIGVIFVTILLLIVIYHPEEMAKVSFDWAWVGSFFGGLTSFIPYCCGYEFIKNEMK